MSDYYVHTYAYRVIQQERSILWEVLVSVVVRKIMSYDYVYNGGMLIKIELFGFIIAKSLPIVINKDKLIAVNFISILI